MGLFDRIEVSSEFLMEDYSYDKLEAVMSAIEALPAGMSTTNSELLKDCKGYGFNAQDIGLIRNELRKQRRIKFDYVVTGRKASGSGRFYVEII